MKHDLLNVIDRYQVKFAASQDIPLGNSLVTVNSWLSQFISDHYTVTETERLLKGISEILTDRSTEFYEFETQSLTLAIINTDITKIYQYSGDYEGDRSISPDYEIPTDHLQIIISAWKDHLIKSPYTKGK